MADVVTWGSRELVTVTEGRGAGCRPINEWPSILHGTLPPRISMMVGSMSVLRAGWSITAPRRCPGALMKSGT